MSLLPLLMPVAAMKSRRNETEQTHLSFSSQQMPPSFRSEIVQNEIAHFERKQTYGFNARLETALKEL
jgi:hypothetical protein